MVTELSEVQFVNHTTFPVQFGNNLDFFKKYQNCNLRFLKNTCIYFHRVGEQIGFEVLVFGPAGPDIEPGRCTFLSILVFRIFF